MSMVASLLGNSVAGWFDASMSTMAAVIVASYTDLPIKYKSRLVLSETKIKMADKGRPFNAQKK